MSHTSGPMPPSNTQPETAYSANSTGVQPLGWQSALPRAEYQAYTSLSLWEDCGWYEVYRVLPGVYAIYEPGHFQEVISYLILGSERALLWDTGMGIAPIRPLVERLTNLPILAVNSHNHFDHVGGNWEFPEVLAWPGPGSEARAAAGYSREFLLPMMAEDSLAKPLPAGFQTASYAIRPWHIAPLVAVPGNGKTGLATPAISTAAAPATAATPGDGATAVYPSATTPPPALVATHAAPAAAAAAGFLFSSPPPAALPAPAASLCSDLAFDLGGRRLELLHTPGHTPDSIMLLDSAAGILFTGDTVYPAALYAHFDSSEYGRSSLDVYANTMNSLQSLAPALSCLCCSHNVPLNKPALLGDIAAGFQEILSGQSKGYVDEEGLLRHDFQGFAIITGNP